MLVKRRDSRVFGLVAMCGEECDRSGAGSLVTWTAAVADTPSIVVTIEELQATGVYKTILTAAALTGTGAVTLVPSDRFYLSVGVNISVAPAVSTQADLGIEGVLNGATDSRMVVPWP